MSSNELKLQVIFSMLEKVTAPLKKIIGESSNSGRALKAVRDRLKELDKQQKDISGFRKMHSGLRETSTRLGEAQHKVEALAQKMRAAESPTRTMTREFERATKAARLIKEQHQEQSQKLQVLRSRLHDTGISTQNLGTHERNLRKDIAATNAQMTIQQQKLTDLAKKQEKVSAAKQRMEKTRSAAGSMAGTGIGMTMAGGAIGAPIVSALGEAKHYETEVQRIRALGLGDKASNEAISFSQNMKTTGTSALENLELVRDAMTVFADSHHATMVAPTLAKMKFANSAMYGEEEGAEKGQTFMNMLKVIELRGGLASQGKFEHEANLVQKVLTATGGRVGPNEWLNFIKTGGVAAKGLKDESFFYKMEPLIQEMGGNRVGTGLMSAYSNLYQGKTTVRSVKEMDRLGLLDPNKVEYNKIGMIKQIKPGALAGGDLFKSDPMQWMETVLLPKLAAKGITDPEQVKDSIANIMSNRTASGLFTQMYLQRDQIHKNERLNAGAAGINELNTRASGTAKGMELDAQAKYHSAQKEFGEQTLPMYTAALNMATGALGRMATFMKEHPTLTKVMAVSFAVLAGVLVVMGTATLALASMIGPFAILRYGLTMLGVQGGVVMPVLRGIAIGFGWIRAALFAMSSALLTNPIGLIILGIAVSALLIYTYWEPIKTFFSAVWQEIRTAFDGGIGGIAALILNWSPLGLFYRAFAGVMGWFGIDMPAKFTDFGANLMQGMVNGITNGLTYVREAITGAGESVVNWFKEKLGIHSPSVVFAELGQFTMQGLSQGLERGQDGPVSRISALSKRLTQAGAGLAISAASGQLAFAQTEPIRFDNRPPVAARGSAPATPYRSQDNVQIIIQTQPGMDSQAIAAAVAAELDRREREKLASKRSSLHDYDEY